MTKKELREKAGILGIVGRWDMTKEQLEKAIEKAEKEIAQVEKEIAEVTKENKEEKQKEVKEVKIDRQVKDSYIEKAEVGTIVAFEREDGAVKSAAIVNKSLKRKMLKLQTAYGKEYIVPFDKVLWVKTTGRFPRNVYMLLKAGKKGCDKK